MTSVKRSVRVIISLITAVTLGVTLAFAGQVSPANADPDAVAEARKRLAAIEAEASAIDAKYTELQDQLDTVNAQLKQADADIKSQTTKVDGMRAAVSQLALSQYQSSGFDVTVQMLSTDTEDNFMSQLSTMQALTDRTNDRFQVLQAEQAKLESLQTNAEANRDAISKATAEQAALAKQYDAKEADAEAVLARLSSEERARLDALEAAEAQPPTTPTNPKPSPSTPTKPSTPSEPVTPPPANGRAGAAVAYARAQVGKSYRMGATGPGAYDCSGLMLRAWGSAGVSLPRTSQSQYRAGVRISVSQLRPGDLVFYYGGISHVAMYVGNGMIVHAANRRSGVRYAPLHSMPIAGARRVG